MISKVREWLETQGFALEMRTASAFRKAGFDDVRQSSIYVDERTRKPREIDVLAHDMGGNVGRGIVDIRFFVECKSSKKPWVLLCSPEVLVYNRFFTFAAMSEKARRALIQHLHGTTHFGEETLFDRLPWLRKDDLTGYSLRQALSSSDADVAYAAAAAVSEACANFVNKCDGERLHQPEFSFAFPVIVIDGPLFRCSLTQNGNVQLAETEEGEFLFFLADFSTCIRVVTSGRLPAFALEAKRVADQIRAELKAEEDEVWKSMIERARGSAT
jgi:hypothetical protein